MIRRITYFILSNKKYILMYQDVWIISIIKLNINNNRIKSFKNSKWKKVYTLVHYYLYY